MRRRGLRFVLLFSLLTIPGGDARAERIRAFGVDVVLQQDGSFDVTEKITYDFGALEKHGIYREIPLEGGAQAGRARRIRLRVEEVSDHQGRALPHRVSRDRGALRIRIGDPDRTVSGVHEYSIRYRVRRAILWFDDHDELYWNATGTEWPHGIDRASARVWLPPGAGEAEIRLACFTGPRGARARACQTERLPQSASFVTTAALAAREGLTLVVGLPKGVLQEPPAWRRQLDRLLDAGGAWWLLPLAALGGMTHLWRTRGRDPTGLDAIPVRYDPPDGVSPAEMGVVLDERADLEDLTATLLDLAVRGFLCIEEIESTRFLFFSSRDFRLRREAAGTEDLKRHERLLLEALFGGGDAVLVSSLRNEFHRHLPQIRKALYRAVSREDGFFPTSPDRVRRVWAVCGGVVGALAFAGHGLALLAPFAALAVGAAGGILLAFSRVMPRRTRRGRRAQQEILGFREFVRRVDADRLERLGGRSAARFEAVLPYAIVLGVADQWADAFASIYSEPPRWYRSSRPVTSFHPRQFVGDVGQSLHTIGRALASTPGGSRGSGFGGSSGGGFGGGGGGSW